MKYLQYNQHQNQYSDHIYVISACCDQTIIISVIICYHTTIKIKQMNVEKKLKIISMIDCVKRNSSRYRVKDGEKIGIDPKHDINRAGKVKINETIWECHMGKQRAKRLSKGRAKKRRLYNKMMQKNNYT
jgi:hypothetical protein